MTEYRIDETQQRLLNWSEAKGFGERLATQVLYGDGYQSVDPSHPNGGKDGGRDGHVIDRDGNESIMACYFPRGKQTINTIVSKLKEDAEKIPKWGVSRMAFVTGQEITLSERDACHAAAKEFGLTLDLFHMERVAAILDRPDMHSTRKQFLHIDYQPELEVDVHMGVAGWAVLDDDNKLREALLDYADQQRREAADAPQLDPLTAALMRGPFGRPAEPPPPPTAAELDQQQAEERKQVERDWPSAIGYMAARGLPLLQVTLTNRQLSFLEDVELVATIAGARGVRFTGTDFVLEKMLDPEWRRPAGPGGAVALDFDDLAYLRPDGAVTWRNRDASGSLEVRVKLDTLRSTPAWTSEDETDLIVLARDPSATSLPVEWTLTAKPYGTHNEGSFELPVASIAAVELFRAAEAAERVEDPEPPAPATD
ncbi:hypothetical protein [Tsukamurella hominis]|uniref:hypothetical protein n=1 Tax=Tsukamurella hominis TaxID=1970232 RepID=UPI0039ED3F5D